MFRRISVLKPNLHCGGIEMWGGNHFVKIGLSVCVSCVSKMLRRPVVTPPDTGRHSQNVQKEATSESVDTSISNVFIFRILKNKSVLFIVHILHDL